jgi:prepilin peptidase CpaA
MPLFFGVTLLTLLVVIGWFDVRERRVPNPLVAGIAGLYALAVATSALPLTPLADLAVAGIFLAVGVALWLPGWLGGGDAKLLAALGLWAGPARALDLAFATTVAGGLLALALLLFGRVARGRDAVASAAAVTATGDVPGRGPGVASGEAPRPTLPYAVAIALGAAVALRDVFPV